MAYTTPITFVALSTLTAAQLNSIQSNISALWPYTAAGDIPYAASSSVLSALAKGTAGQALIMGASLPEWGATGINKRQGGNASDWSIYGSTDYTTTASKIYIGVTRITVTDGNYSSSLITFPSAYTNKPVILVGGIILVSGGISVVSAYYSSLSNSQVYLGVFYSDTPTFTADITWMSIGE